MKLIYNNEGPYALITGASRGLGKEFAKELASRGYNLLMVSLKNDGLPEISKEIAAQYHITVYHLETDLARTGSVFKLAEWAKSKGEIEVLVNNAGVGGTMAFDEAPIDYIDNIIQLNIRATALLTKLMLPALRKRKSAFILNVASMASFCPIAYKTVYPASKAFIWSFSRGLNEELKDTCVFVGVVHPGPMRTNPEVIKRIDSQSRVGKLGVLSADRTAKIAITRLFNRHSLIIPGFFNKINWILSKIVPVSIRLNVVSKVLKREINPYPVTVK